jgi:hypothetical protein
MGTKLDIRGYVNPFTPGQTEAGQRLVMPTGAEIYVEDRTGKVIDKLIASVRRSSVVAVKDMDCLAPVQFNSQKRRRLLSERVDTIKVSGGLILELSTGRRSNKGQLAQMLATAYERIRNSGRGRKSAGNGSISVGAPRRYPRSGYEYGVMEAQYYSRRNKNMNERRMAMKKQIGYAPSRGWLMARLGSPDGNQLGNEK